MKSEWVNNKSVLYKFQLLLLKIISWFWWASCYHHFAANLKHFNFGKKLPSPNWGKNSSWSTSSNHISCSFQLSIDSKINLLWLLLTCDFNRHSVYQAAWVLFKILNTSGRTSIDLSIYPHRFCYEPMVIDRTLVKLLASRIAIPVLFVFFLWVFFGAMLTSLPLTLVKHEWSSACDSVPCTLPTICSYAMLHYYIFAFSVT